MNAESVKSLLDLLVKKAGFDLSKNDSAKELSKTNETIESLERQLKEADNDFDKKVISKTLESLKIKKVNWENNAEVIGRELIEAYKSGESLELVTDKIDKLATLATEDEDKVKEGSLMSFIYTSIKKLEEEIKELDKKIETFEYKDKNTIELDKKTHSYLKEKQEEMRKETDVIQKDLDNLDQVELKDKAQLEKIKEYVAATSKELTRLLGIKEDTISKDVSVDVWSKLEKMIVTLATRLDGANDTITKLQKTLEETQKNREVLIERKKYLGAEIASAVERYEKIEERIDKDDYVDTLQKVVDMNNKELLELRLKGLHNKKEVIYIDIGQVTEELKNEWLKNGEGAKPEDIPKPEIPKEEEVPKEEIKEIIEKESKEVEELVSQIQEEIEETKEVIKIDKKEVIEDLKGKLEEEQAKAKEIEETKDKLKEAIKESDIPPALNKKEEATDTKKEIKLEKVVDDNQIVKEKNIEEKAYEEDLEKEIDKAVEKIDKREETSKYEYEW